MKRRLVALGLALVVSIVGAACDDEEEEEEESLGRRPIAVEVSG